MLCGPKHDSFSIRQQNISLLAKFIVFGREKMFIFFVPKEAGPIQAVFVDTALALVDSLLLTCHSTPLNKV